MSEHLEKRTWRLTDAERDQIRVELGLPGATLKGVARKWKVHPNTIRNLARHGTLPPLATEEHPPVVEGAPEGVSEAREILWKIFRDEKQPGAARGLIFEKLKESEGWGQKNAERLPPPKSREELVERMITLLTSLPEDVRGEVVSAFPPQPTSSPMA